MGSAISLRAVGQLIPAGRGPAALAEEQFQRVTFSPTKLETVPHTSITPSSFPSIWRTRYPEALAATAE